MKKAIFILAAVSLLGSVAALAGEEGRARFRMDCHFQDEHKGCVSGATYEVDRRRSEREIELRDVKYGVSCDRQTIFNNEGVAFSTNDPESTIEDHIRPKTSSVPKTVLFWKGALVKEGTYKSHLELEGETLKGVCDVVKHAEERHD